MSRSRSDTWGPFGAAVSGRTREWTPSILSSGTDPGPPHASPDEGPPCRCPAPLPAPPGGGWSASLGCLAAVGGHRLVGIVIDDRHACAPRSPATEVEQRHLDRRRLRPAPAGGVAVVCRISALDGGRTGSARSRTPCPRRAPASVHRVGDAAHQRAGRDRGRRHAAPGCSTPLSRDAVRGAGVARGAGAHPAMVAIRARLGRLAASHLGSGSDTRCRTASIGTRARCRSTEVPPRSRAGAAHDPGVSDVTETANQASFLTQEAFDRLKAELDAALRPGPHRDRQEDRGRARGGRPQGERRLPRRQGGAGQDGGPHPPAHPAARDRRHRRDPGRRRHRRARHGRHRRHVRRRGDLPARLPRDRRRLDLQVFSEKSPLGAAINGHKVGDKVSYRPPTASRSRSRCWPPSPTRAERPPPPTTGG